MLKDIKITPASPGKRIISWLIDILLLIASYAAIYFGLLFSVFSLVFSYADNVTYIKDTNAALNLKLSEGEGYKKYENVIMSFYFDIYPDQIKEMYDEYYGKDYTIEHIYNIQVLSLPETPTPEYHSNDMFTYVQDQSGAYNVDAIGVVLSELGGYNHDRNMSDYFYYEYTELNNLVIQFNSKYAISVNNNLLYESIARISSFGISVLVFYLIIPFTNKHRATIGEKICCFAHVNYSDGYAIKKYKTCLRPFVEFLIPAILIYLASSPAFYVFAFFYQFLSVLTMLIGEKHQDFADKILKMSLVDENDSLIFINETQEKEYEDNEEYIETNDKDFLDKLSNITPLNFSINEENKNERKE